MKKMLLMLAVVLSFPASGQTNEGSLAIKIAITDYIEGWATGSAKAGGKWMIVNVLWDMNSKN